jgi:hypothetical protein
VYFPTRIGNASSKPMTFFTTARTCKPRAALQHSIRGGRRLGGNTKLPGLDRSGRERRCVAVVSATTKVVFEAYVEQVLVPILYPGQIVVMDNLCAHKGRGSKSWSRSEAASSCTYHPTRQTSIPSRRPSPSPDKEPLAKSRRQNPRGPNAGARRGDLGSQLHRRPGLLKVLRLQPSGSPTMTTAI